MAAKTMQQRIAELQKRLRNLECGLDNCDASRNNLAGIIDDFFACIGESQLAAEIETCYDTAPIGLCVFDTGLRYIRVNNCLAEMNGRAAAEHIGRTIHEIVPSIAGQAENFARRIVKSGEPIRNIELVGETAAEPGVQRTWMESWYPLKDDNGRVVAINVAAEDITEAKQAEEELRRARDELELMVRNKTVELLEANEELEVANKELHAEIEEHEMIENELRNAKAAVEDAARAKAAFIANMSLEIRTPMNAVLGMTGLLMEEKLTPKQLDFVETIKSDGDALMNIINDILDISKIECDDAELEYQPFNLRACIETSLDLVAQAAASKGLNLAYIIERETPEWIVCDSTRLRQILGNLLNNAVKFTDKGEVLLTVSARPATDCYEIMFAVEDTGIGIPRERMDLLFKPFARVDASISYKYCGTGLGLAISKKLAELMGGRFWVKSEPGKGSKFYFTIEAEAAPGTSTAMVEAQPMFKGKRMLIVEENKTNRRILRQQTRQWGMVPVITASELEALEMIEREEHFDAAIVGEESTAEKICRYRKDLPLIMLTSVGAQMKAEPDAILTRPIKRDQLCSVLRDILSRQPVSMKAAASVSADQSPQHILLVEDIVSNQKVIMEMLKRLGYCADVTANGVEALQHLEHQWYDVVLMDIRMPLMNGLDAASAIRQRWPDGGPKIIAITAYAMEGDRKKCLQAGMDGYISKPVKLEDLRNVLAEVSPREKRGITPSKKDAAQCQTGRRTPQTAARSSRRLLHRDDAQLTDQSLN